jgi:pimeloyl-ACP methyl ester carboxylesterase
MKQVTLRSGTIRYRDQGEGPAVLFVHGLLVDGELWHDVSAALAATHRCIVPDWPLGAHTLPMQRDADLTPAGVAQLVAEFMEALALEEVTLVGNDTGGAICQLVAAYHPERVGRLVLTNCDALEVFPPKAFHYLALVPRVPGMMTVLSKALLYLPFLQRLSSAYGAVTRRPIASALLRRWVTPGARNAAIRRDTAKFIRGVSPRVTVAAAKALAAFRRPALLLWADEPFFPLALAERLATHLPDCRIVRVDDSRTFVPLDQPALVADQIARFARPSAARARVQGSFLDGNGASLRPASSE